MSTSIFLSNFRLQVIEGSTQKDKIQVNKYNNYLFPEGTMLNGTIMNHDVLSSILKELKTTGLDKANLVIDSSKIVTRLETVPNMNRREMKVYFSNQIKDILDTDEEYLIDYTVLHSSKKEGQVVLFVAAPKELIASYIDIFNENNIEVTSIDVLTNTIIRLVNFIDSLANQTFTVVEFNGNDLTVSLFVDGKFAYSEHNRVYSERGSVAFVSEFGNIDRKFMQFFNSNFRDKELTNHYLFGLDDYELDMIQETVLDGTAKSTMDLETIINADNNFDFHNYVSVGNLLPKRKEDIDLLSNFYHKESALSKYRGLYKWAIPPLVLILIFGGVFTYLKISNSNLKGDIGTLNSELIRLNAANDNDPNVKKASDLDTLRTELNNLEALNNNIGSYPQINKDIMESIRLALSGTNITSIAFKQEDGSISMTIESNDNTGCQQAVRNLRNTLLYDKIQYTGYAETGGVVTQITPTVDMTNPTTDTTTQTTDPNATVTTPQEPQTVTSPVTYKADIVCVLKGGN